MLNNQSQLSVKKYSNASKGSRISLHQLEPRELSRIERYFTIDEKHHVKARNDPKIDRIAMSSPPLDKTVNERNHKAGVD